MDLGALWRMQRAQSLPEDRNRHAGTTASFMQRNLRQSQSRDRRQLRAGVATDKAGTETLVKNVKSTKSKSKSKPRASVLGPIDDIAGEEEYSSGGSAAAFPALGPPTTMAPPPAVYPRPSSPTEGPFQLKSMYQRAGTGSFPLIVDEERSMKGLQSSGDSDQFCDLIRPPSSALFKF